MNQIFSTPFFNNFSVYGVTQPKVTPNFGGYNTINTNDSYTSNPIYSNFADKNTITNIARSNPKVMQILNENKIPLKVNVQELEDLKKGHLKDTRVTIAKMYSALPPELKAQVNLPELQQAAMLHDFGKVLIPDKILNKDGKLDDQERKIMELHSELGAELLKNQGVSENVLNLIKYHHQTSNGTGYPQMNNYEYGLEAEMLNAADKYSALRENRCYKKGMENEQALGIIAEDVENGKISPEVYQALERSCNI